MSLPTPSGLPEPSVRSSPPESRMATMIVFMAGGSVLAVLAGAVFFPTIIGPLAYSALVVIGSVAGAGLHVLARALRR